MNAESSRNKLLALVLFLSVVMFIIIAAISMPRRALMLHVTPLHAKKKTNYFQISINASMVVSKFYLVCNKFLGVSGFFQSNSMH